ncbi:Aspartate racemase [Microbacterium esteraromaticum]|uniref:Aspartate racemase n=2 Tax=Microbacterium esteraromaticum TaxID=57043 RepID=A0A1R4IKQ3_9MICO|nr:Aspartate racemase [Microbacterium esteraromaticum]
MHIVSDQIEAAISVPFVHIVDSAAEAISRAGLRTVGLLGTAFTMERRFYRDRLTKHGIATVIPNADDRRAVHSVIYDELVHGIIRGESRDRYREVIERVVAAGAEGIILGCTEIELLISSEGSPVPVFPTTAIHVDAALSAAEDGSSSARA